MLNIYNYISYEDMLEFSKKYYKEKVFIHEKKVVSNAQKIMRSIRAEYNFSDAEENLLYLSALIHDIGYFVNKDKHHKHSKNIVLADKYLDIVPKELRGFLAVIVASHRKSLDENIELYSDDIKNKLLRLIAILRIADSLDHGHKYNTCIISVEKYGDLLLISMQGEGYEKIYPRFNEKAKLFNEVFDLNAELLEINRA
jgi:Exopolyphosphatase